MQDQEPPKPDDDNEDEDIFHEAMRHELEEELADDAEDGNRVDLGFIATGLTPIKNIDIPERFFNRFTTGVEEVDHLFGGDESPGFLPGSVITSCGKNGTGKTTFWLQVLARLQSRGLNVGYYSGEESKEQIALKSTHINVPDVPIANQKMLEVILKDIATGLDFIVIDSFQALLCEAIHLRGKRLQQHMINLICKAAQENECTIVVIMHLTKGGQLKGDTCVPHTVDVNMVIRSGFKEYGDKAIRILEIPDKNRFGPCLESLAHMSRSGFSFGVVIEQLDEAATGSGKTNKRSDNKKMEMQQILDLPFPVLTPEMVMEGLGVDFNYAYGRLTELMRNKKLEKIGKGADAIFKKI
jgi:predicted ATP-dependent serine protease